MCKWSLTGRAAGINTTSIQRSTAHCPRDTQMGIETVSWGPGELAEDNSSGAGRSFWS